MGDKFNLKEFHEMDADKRQEMKKRVIQEYETKWNAVNLTRKLAEDLKS